MSPTNQKNDLELPAIPNVKEANLSKHFSSQNCSASRWCVSNAVPSIWYEVLFGSSTLLQVIPWGNKAFTFELWVFVSLCFKSEIDIFWLLQIIYLYLSSNEIISRVGNLHLNRVQQQRKRHRYPEPCASVRKQTNKSTQAQFHGNKKYAYCNFNEWFTLLLYQLASSK